MHSDPQLKQILSRSEMISLASRCGQPTSQLETFLFSTAEKAIPAEVCFDAARVLLKTLIIGLEKEILALTNVQQIKDNIEGAIQNGSISLSFWNELYKRDQDEFHALQKVALEKINNCNDGTISEMAIKKMQEITKSNLDYFKLRYVDLTSEEVIGLFITANRSPEEIQAVSSLLKLKDQPDEAKINPRQLGIAAVTLAYRAERRFNSHRPDSITCHQALQLIELSLNAISLLGQDSSLANVDLGNAQTAAEIKSWATKQKILNPIEAVGAKAATIQDRNDFLLIKGFYREIFQQA